ncbi:uncharacterized protein LOC135497760 [Lineus longissimus]|uniref:uncharacterized protein LOC135497760 n=1 Tax=Lineus longissimus TaxID=88925 RepID=UPI00315D41C2
MKMATGERATNELSDIAKGLKPGPLGKDDDSSKITANDSNSNAGNPLDAGGVTDEDIKQNPEKFFESLSSKIEDQLRMLEWEMTSSFQENAISDFLGNSLYDDDTFDQDISGGYFEIGKTYDGCPKANRTTAQDGSGQISREDISARSSISSMSSIFDDNDKRSDIGADGDVENNTSESSRSASCDSGNGGILAASIMLVENDQRQKRNVDCFISELVNSIMRDISTIFSDDHDANLWTRAYDTSIVTTVSTSYNQYHNETDKNITPDSRHVLFSKTFSGEQVTFSDDRWFPHENMFQFPLAVNHRLQDQAYGSASTVRRRSHRRDAGSARSDEPERRIFHRARYQMHDIQHELRRLSWRLHDIKDDRAESSDAAEN